MTQWSGAAARGVIGEKKAMPGALPSILHAPFGSIDLVCPHQVVRFQS